MENLSELIELLVDGELDETTRNQVIRMLDEQPDGWKQCSLGFLEQQALQEILKPTRTSDDAIYKSSQDVPADRSGYSMPIVSGSSHPSSTSRLDKESTSVSYVYAEPSRNHTTPKWFALLAGSLLLGFGIGYLLRFHPIDAPTDTRFAQSEEAFDSVEQSRVKPQPIGSPKPGESFAVYVDKAREASQNAPSYPGLPIQTVSNSSIPSVPQVRYLSIRTDENQRQNVPVPCFDHKSIDPKSFRTYSQEASDRIVERFRNDGHKVGVHRQNLIFRGENGEHILVPVEDTIIRYSNSGEYQ